MAVNLTTVAPVASPQVGTFMAADVGDLRTLVNIHTTPANMFESRLADASHTPPGNQTVSVVTTFFTYKPIRPSGLRQVIVTGVNVAKALVKFNLGFGKIFFDRKIYHGGLLFYG